MTFIIPEQLAFKPTSFVRKVQIIDPKFCKY